jgi:type VI secretion system protein ImpE
MTPEELLKSGDPDGALAALQSLVRVKPQDVKLRIFLFQLLCVLGDWKRAVQQVKICGELSPDAVPMAQTYREAIICEVYREKVFAGEKTPLVMGEPQEWLALLTEALRLDATGHAAEAAAVRARAFDQAPTSPGDLNGTTFDWIADADMRFGPVLEAIIDGKYFWLPFSQIQAMKVDPPVDLRDMVWTPVDLVLSSGGAVVALIPTRYPGTTKDGTPAEKLARATSWHEVGDGTFAGRGLRLLSTGDTDTAINDIRIFNIAGAAPEAA